LDYFSSMSPNYNNTENDNNNNNNLTVYERLTCARFNFSGD